MNSLALSLMFTLCLILVSCYPLPANARAHGHRALLGNNPDLISQICKETLHDEINCTKILRADPKIPQAKNFLEFSKAVLELALKEGIKGHDFLKGLVKKNKVPAIVECATFDYDGVVGSFKSALGELKDDPQTASYDAKVAGDGAKNCQQALNVAHIVNPAISSLNYQISLLSNIAFLATNKITI